MKENKIKSSNGGRRILIALGVVMCIAAIILQKCVIVFKHPRCNPVHNTVRILPDL